MRDRNLWAALAPLALFAWVFSLVLPGPAAWVAVPAVGLWLLATVLSLPPTPAAGTGTFARRLRRNAKWMPGVTLFGAAAFATGWWLPSLGAPFSWSLIGLGVALPPVGAYMFASGRIGMEEALEVDDEGVRRLEDGQVTARLAWHDVHQVRVVTTADGPVDEDFFWVVSGADGRDVISVPNGLAQDELVPRLLRLEGFDHDRLVESLGSVSPATFVVWRRDR